MLRAFWNLLFFSRSFNFCIFFLPFLLWKILIQLEGTTRQNIKAIGCWFIPILYFIIRTLGHYFCIFAKSNFILPKFVSQFFPCYYGNSISSALLDWNGEGEVTRDFKARKFSLFHGEGAGINLWKFFHYFYEKKK